MPHPLTRQAAIRFVKQVNFFQRCSRQELFAFIEKTKDDPENQLFKYTEEEIKIFETEGRHDMVEASVEMQGILLKYIKSDKETQDLLNRVTGKQQ